MEPRTRRFLWAIPMLLRRGNAGANTAADHITVLDQALAQIPDAHRHGVPVLVRADGAGCSKAFLAHIRSLHRLGGHRPRTRRHRRAAGRRLDRRGGRLRPAPRRRGGGRADRPAPDYPTGTRVLVRRERPHPGAQLDAFEDRDRWRYQCLATDTAVGQLAFLDARTRWAIEEDFQTGKGVHEVQRCTPGGRFGYLGAGRRSGRAVRRSLIRLAGPRSWGRGRETDAWRRCRSGVP
jgi:hypothetical protein